MIGGLRTCIGRSIARTTPGELDKDFTALITAQLISRTIIGQMLDIYQGIPTLGLAAQNDQILPKEDHFLPAQAELTGDTTVPHHWAIWQDTREPYQHYIKFSPQGYTAELAVTTAFLQGEASDFKSYDFSPISR